jgi:hypothetical protein
MNKFSFSLPIFLWLLALAIFSIFIIFGISEPTREAVRALHDLISSQPHKERKKNWKKEQELTKQTRWDVVKKMWQTKGPLRRTFQIQGTRSDLGVYLYKAETHLIETFYNAKGVLQQDLFYTLPDGTELQLMDEGRYCKRNHGSGEDFPVHDPSLLEPKQNCKYFEARSAIYDFHTHVFVLHDVTFWTYTLSGHEVQQRPNVACESIGVAKSMTIHPNNIYGPLSFCAEDLKMQILGDGELW